MSPAPKDSKAGAGAGAPLLPKLNSSSPPGCDRESRSGASLTGAVFNVSTTIIGAGIMSIPATVKVIGVVPAFALIVIVALLVDVSVEFLLRFTHSGESTTYASLMAESFGRIGSLMVQMCIMVTNFGCLIIYQIIIGDVLCGSQPGGSVHLGILQEWFGTHWWNLRPFALLFVAVFVLLPLVSLRRVESLRFSSAVAVLLAVVFVGVSSVLAIAALFEGKTKNPRMLPHLDENTSFFDLFTTVPVIVTAFTFHFNVHPIGVELGNPSNMISAVRIALALCAAIYFTIGFFGYLLFGDSIMADILVNFDQSSGTGMGAVLNDVVRLSYALHLVLVFPLLNFSLRANVDELLFPKKRLLAKDDTRFMLITCILLVLSYLAAITIPSIWYLFQFMGSTAAVSIAFIFPGAIALRDVHGISSRRDKIVAISMIILAVSTSIIAISSNIQSLIKSKL